MDGCQALGLVSERKYERNYSGDGYGYLYADGVSFVKLASLSEFMSDPLKYKIQLLEIRMVTGKIFPLCEVLMDL